jgi:hypothetical protein
MKTNRTTIALNLLTVFGLTVASVSGMTMTYDSSIPALQQTINVRFDGTNTSIYAGQIGVRFDNGITALLFCADPFTALRSGPVEVTPLTTNQFANGDRLAWMFNTYVPTFTQSWEAAAFQLATCAEQLGHDRSDPQLCQHHAGRQPEQVRHWSDILLAHQRADLLPNPLPR